MVKKSKKVDQKYEHSVKPYYYPSENCFIVYSPKKQLSLKVEFVALREEEVKKKFGFNLICGDIEKSTNQAFKYISDNKLLLSYPKTLEPLKDGKTPEVYGNTNEIFILHKSPAKMGLEVVAGGNFKKGVVVAEYLGEKLSFLDSVSDSTYLISDAPVNVYVDAKNYGNIARFFNHCPMHHDNPNVLTANIIAVAWPVSETQTKMFFVTSRDINTFEPICWDYGENYHFNQAVELIDSKTYLPITDHDSL